MTELREVKLIRTINAHATALLRVCFLSADHQRFVTLDRGGALKLNECHRQRLLGGVTVNTHSVLDGSNGQVEVI